LQKEKSGAFLDKRGRLVNKRGYLIDKSGNVIDIRGKLMFDYVILDKDGEIPIVFRTGVLQVETGSELSQLMDDMNQNNKEKIDNDGETSLDS
jgi:hypothetical protein